MQSKRVLNVKHVKLKTKSVILVQSIGYLEAVKTNLNQLIDCGEVLVFQNLFFPQIDLGSSF